MLNSKLICSKNDWWYYEKYKAVKNLIFAANITEGGLYKLSEMVGLNIHGAVDYTIDALSGVPLSSKKQNHASGLKGIVAKTKESIIKDVDDIILDPKPNKQESVFFSKTTGKIAVNI